MKKSQESHLKCKIKGVKMESFKIEDSNVNDKKISDDLLQKSFITTFLIQNTDTKEIYCKYSSLRQ